MELSRNIKGVVYTNKAKCLDCNRCVRFCPVKAIKIEKGQAFVLPEKCIACGTCVLECPQHAKNYHKDIEIVQNYFQSRENVIVSIAPSFAGIYTDWERQRLPSALRMLGFSYVSETAIAAYHVAQKSKEYIEKEPNKTHIFSACPALVSYIEKYQPEFVKNLVPIMSPMVAHGKILREKFPKGTKIVFIGPCIAKKDEILRKDYKGIIDVVLTFEELQELFEWKKVDIAKCETSAFDDDPNLHARLFALEGGLLKTAHIDTNLFNVNTLAISGFDEISDVLSTIKNSNKPYIIEPLFCSQGCINGPAILRKQNKLESRSNILEYDDTTPKAEPQDFDIHKITANYRAVPLNIKYDYSDDEIKEIFKKTGKFKPEDELNCGACGYSSCKEKAVAVLQGIAELEMCVPYMKRLAEEQSSLVIQTSPNGIVTLDVNLQILSMNPSFKKMFACSDAIIGKKISYLIDPDPFEKLAAGVETEIRKIVRYPNYNLICHQICYATKDEHHYIGIFVDVTDMQQSKDKLNDLKNETIIQAQDLIDHQIQMAQELARFLGESTAKGEVLLNSLINAISK